MKKILIIKIGAIGDVIMALPMLTYLRSKKELLHITWVCGEAPFPILQATGLVDKMIVLKEKELLAGNIFQKMKEVLRVWKALAGSFFDEVFIAQRDPRYRLLTFCSRAKKICSFNGKEREPLVPGRYHSYEYLRLITGIDGPEAPKTSLPLWNLPLPSKYEPFFEKLRSKKIIALAPGGAKNAVADDAIRRWPVENYAALARRLIKEGFEVLITGAHTDHWILPHFQDVAVHLFVGELSTVELVSLYQRCDLVITHDSGPLHMAKLAAVNILALFGPTIPSEKTSSLEKTQVLWGGEHLSCRPCLGGKLYAACKNNLCMQEITVDQVFSMASRTVDTSISCMQRLLLQPFSKPK